MLKVARLFEVQLIRSTVFGNPGMNELGDVIVLLMFAAFAVSIAKIVARFVPFNVIVGVAIPPLAVNSPDMVSVPVLVILVVIRPPRGELERLTVPLKIVESEK